MIKLSNTPNLLGISVRGDLEDLNELYDAISRYSELYHIESIENIEKQLQEKKITEIQAENGYRYYSDMHDCILGLNYDIRHAYQGDRNVEFIENGADRIGRTAACIYAVDEEAFEAQREKGKEGNLYFSVEILYPWMLFYMLNFQCMLNNWHDEKLMKKLDFKYDVLLCKHDCSIISHFVMEAWNCLRECLGEKKAQRAYEFVESISMECDCHEYYGSALCNYYCDKKKSSKRLKKSMLVAMLYELVGSEFLVPRKRPKKNGILLEECRKDFESALDYIKEHTGEPFLYQNQLMKELQNYVRDKEYFSYEEREEFFDRYGDVDWERMVW